MSTNTIFTDAANAQHNASVAQNIARIQGQPVAA